MVAALVAAWLLLAAVACAHREQDFYDFKAVNIRGKLVSLEKYRGSVSVHPAASAPPGRGLMGAPCCRELQGVVPRGLLPPNSVAMAPPPPRGHSLESAAPPDPAPVCPGSTWRGPGAQ